MNAPTKVQSADTAREYRRAAYAANVTRMAWVAANWTEHPHSDLCKLRFLDALAHCIDSDLSDETDDVRRELGLDSEGFPTDDAGDTNPHADRVWTPLPVVPLPVDIADAKAFPEFAEALAHAAKLSARA